METQETYSIEGGKQTTIVHQKKYDELPLKGINIIGKIDSPLKYLEKNYICAEPGTFITVNQDELMISLFMWSSNPYTGSSVIGELKLSQKFNSWMINEGKPWECKQLSEFIKMNRNAFEDRSTALTLISELANIRVKSDKEIEKADNNRGDYKAMIVQKIIETNIPKSFQLKIPVFDQQDPITFEVEVYINPQNFSVTLISPDAADIIDQHGEKILNDVVSKLKELRSDIPIIEI